MEQTESRREPAGNGNQSEATVEPTLGHVAPMGIEVRGAVGERIGRVAATWPSYVLVEVRPGADTGYWVPAEAFAGTEDEALVLNVTRAEAEHRGWTERPLMGPEDQR